MGENEEIVLNTAAPTKVESKEKINRFGRIFFNMALALVIISGLCMLSTIITPVFYLAVLAILFVITVAIVVFSLGTTFVMENNPAAKVWGVLGAVTNSDVLKEIVVFCFNITKWFAVAGIVICALSIVFIALGRGKSKKGKIIGLSVMLVGFAVMLAFHLITGGIQ